MQNTGLTPEEVKTYKVVLAALTAYRKDVFEAIDFASSDENMATMYMEKAEGKFQALYRNLNDLLELETSWARRPMTYPWGPSALRP